MACETCGGRGELRADGVTFRCPDCSGTGGRRDPKPGSRGRPSKAVKLELTLTPKVWERVQEAARLNGRKPSTWAADALGIAAAQQINKARSRARA